jgi:hypothetical protein
MRCCQQVFLQRLQAHWHLSLRRSRLAVKPAHRQCLRLRLRQLLLPLTRTVRRHRSVGALSERKTSGSPTSAPILSSPSSSRTGTVLDGSKRNDTYRILSVLCGSCNKWIRLRPNSTYCSIPWESHRKSCLAKNGRLSVSLSLYVLCCTQLIFFSQQLVGCFSTSAATRIGAADRRCARG